jgi:DNA-binding beta-propeller fold protein YncE
VALAPLDTGKSVAVLRTSTTVAHGVTISDDSRYAFVSSEGVGAAPGKVDVVDLRARRVVATVDVAQQASGIAFWKSEGVLDASNPRLPGWRDDGGRDPGGRPAARTRGYPRLPGLCGRARAPDHAGPRRLGGRSTPGR